MIPHHPRFLVIHVEFVIQMREWAHEFQSDGIMVMWLGPKPAVALFKPEYVEVCQRSSEPKFYEI